MRLALSLLVVIGTTVVSPVFGAVDGPSPCRKGSTLTLRVDCPEGGEDNTQLVDFSNKSLTERGGYSVSAHDVSTEENATDEAERQQRRRRLQGRRRGRGGSRRRFSGRRGYRRRQQDQNVPGLLVTKGAGRRRPCPKGYIRRKPGGRCFKRRFVSPNSVGRARDFRNPATGPAGRAFQTSATILPSGAGNSLRGRRRCPGGYLRHSGGRCLRLGSESRPSARRVPKPGSLRDSPEQCDGGRLAWKDGKCIPLATLRTCPTDAYRIRAGFCVRCWVSDKTEEACAKGCAVDERRSKCICCKLDGDNP